MAEKKIIPEVKPGLLTDAELATVRDRVKRVLARVVIEDQYGQDDLDALTRFVDDHGALRGTLTVVKQKLVFMRDNPISSALARKPECVGCNMNKSRVLEVLAVIERTEAR